MKKIKIFMFVCAAVLTAGAFAVSGHVFGISSREYYQDDGSFCHLTAGDSFRYAENHPAFSEFASFIQPWKDRWNLLTTPFESIDFVCRLNHTSTDSILDGFNFVIDAAGEQEIFFDFYTDEERAADPGLEETGLIFIPGDKDKPVAVLASGGGFRSVCLFLEGFPVGKRLHEDGYNVVLLKYRVDPDMTDLRRAEEIQGPKANEDYRRAMRFLFANQKELNINMEDYSVWGFSAGGYLTSMYGLDNEYGYKAEGLPCPAAMVLVYSGWYEEKFRDAYSTMPPVYFAYLPEDDVIGRERADGIVRLKEYLQGLGIKAESSSYHTARHGFGEGRGTDAEGWIQKAAAFWEEQCADLE